MATSVLLPKLNFSMEEAHLASWLVADGLFVAEGQPIYTVETEKAVEEVPSPASGTLRILADFGKTYRVGTELALIE